MLRRVFLVRHCESEANRAGTLEGYGDAPLTTLGRDQAARLAASLAGLRDAALISSPLRRAADTAAAISHALDGLPVALEPRLLAGESLPAHVDWRDPEVVADAGNEALAAVMDALDATPGPLVAVTHRFPLHALLTRLVATEQADAIVDALGNGDILELALDGRRLEGAPSHRPLDA